MSRYLVARVEELPEGSRRIVEAGRLSIGVFNVKGEFYALKNTCPHAGAPLCLGPITGTTTAVGERGLEWGSEGEILRCPWHHWEFRIATGTTITEPVERVKTYPVRVENGMVVLEAGEDTGS